MCNEELSSLVIRPKPIPQNKCKEVMRNNLLNCDST